MVEEFITITELAKVIGISRQAMLKQLKGKINSGQIEARTEGKTYLLRFNTLPTDIKERIAKSQKKAVQKAQKLVQNPGKNINFEKELWSAADKLRGNIDPSEYKYIVLCFIFL